MSEKKFSLIVVFITDRAHDLPVSRMTQEYPYQEVSEKMFDWNVFLNIIIAILQAILNSLPL